MLSLRTNLTSLLAQSSLQTSSNKLNQAIERMTTGFKINNAKDNAANYSISTNLSTKIGAYQVAEENTAMGLDMVTTASETLSLIEDKLSRARALCVQAQNGTYGQQSIDAIKAELSAIVSGLYQTKNNIEFNGIKLLEETHQLSANQKTGFIADVVEETPQIVVSDPTQLASAIVNNTIIGISNAETLAELAAIVNNGNNCSGKTIVLTEDIDLSAYSNWTPIGYGWTSFQGDFNGNGHIISNLSINSTTASHVGLFGYARNSNISNVGVDNAKILSQNSDTGGLIGLACNVTINNCFVSGDILCMQSSVGGLIGNSYSSDVNVTNCYTMGSVRAGQRSAGGLIGGINTSPVTISNCYSTCDASAEMEHAGGLVGYSQYSSISITDSYASGEIETEKYAAGGLVGYANLSSSLTITQSYATGNVSAGTDCAGGLVGECSQASSLILEYSYATGNITSEIYFAGGLVGVIRNSSNSVTITNCYSSGMAKGSSHVGSFIGSNEIATTITNCYSTGTTSGPSGDFVGTNTGTLTIDTVSGKTDSATLKKLIQDGTLSNFSSGRNVGLQVGTDDSSNSSIEMELGISLSGLDFVARNPQSAMSLSIIDKLLTEINAKQVQFGAAENRLTSAMEEIGIKYENLVSTRSTIRDADISEVSSQYIQQQILQQASSTLLATANQSPDLALRLIMNSTI